MAPDPDGASAALAAIRDGANCSIAYAGNHACPDAGSSCSAHNALRLLAAVERVLELHHRRDKPVRTHNICMAHAPWGNDEGYNAGCAACTITEKQVCAEPSCRHECPDDDGWPCPTVLAITAALAGTGKEAGDGS